MIAFKNILLSQILLLLSNDFKLYNIEESRLNKIPTNKKIFHGLEISYHVC